MVEVAEVKSCSNPGCVQPGTSCCSACKITYCCVSCQTADWAHHKEECDGHLLKMGMANLQKAVGFHEVHNFAQTLRFCDLALVKLKKIKKDRPVEALSTALKKKFDALKWNNKCTDPPALDAAFALIESCLHNNAFDDAVFYAGSLWEIINHKHDNKIPENDRPQYIARSAKYLAQATWQVLNYYLSSDPPFLYNLLTFCQSNANPNPYPMNPTAGRSGWNPV